MLDYCLLAGEIKNSQWSCKAKRYFLPVEISARNPPGKWKIFYSFYETANKRFALLPLQPKLFLHYKFLHE
jgi:hypothetical protein